MQRSGRRCTRVCCAASMSGGPGGRRGGSPPKVSGCRRAGARQPAPMLPPPTLAPLEPHKGRALTTIYAPRKQKTRKNRTAQARAMIDNEIPTKPGLSPFHPLPAIGQTKTNEQRTKVLVFDLNKNENLRSATIDEDKPIELHEVKALTPRRIRINNRNNSLDCVTETRPQHLIRENTYDVINPIYVTPPGLKKTDPTLSRRSLTMILHKENKQNLSPAESNVSPKTRFKNAAMQVAKLPSYPETGKLLCLRKKDTIYCFNEESNTRSGLDNVPESPTQKLTKLTEIFQCLDMKGRHRNKVKENSWF